MKVIFPVHPRTKKTMEDFSPELLKKFILIPPLPYFSFMSLVYHCAFVLTDSGGIQEETTFLKKPCFTLRENTERPITTEIGSNYLIYKELSLIQPTLADFSSTKVRIPDLWDGKAGVRILKQFSLST